MLDDFSRFIIAWKLCTTMKAEDITATLDLALKASCHKTWRSISGLMTAGSRHYSDLKNVCVWVKPNGGMGSLYRSQHELVTVFKAGRAHLRNNIELGRHGRHRTRAITVG